MSPTKSTRRAPAARTKATAAKMAGVAAAKPASRKAGGKRSAAVSAPPRTTAASATAGQIAEARSRLAGKTRSPAQGGAMTSTRTLHELQVHQIELEMQNEELRQANEQLATLHQRYHDLYDFAPVAYYTVDVERRLVELNLAGSRLLGGERGQLPGKRLAEFVHPQSREAFDQMIARALVRNELVEDALVLLPRGQPPVYVKAQVRRFEQAPEAPAQARIVMMDLTALKSANEELARSLENFFRYWRP
jgi:PAS domain S-box-containing protein